MKTEEWEREFDELFENNRHVELSLSGDYQVKDFIRTQILEAEKRGAERAVEACIKYIREGNVAGSFSDCCDCERCDRFEKQVRKELLRTARNLPST